MERKVVLYDGEDGMAWLNTENRRTFVCFIPSSCTIDASIGGRLAQFEN
jgi:hypothetical protein